MFCLAIRQNDIRQIAAAGISHLNRVIDLTARLAYRNGAGRLLYSNTCSRHRGIGMKRIRQLVDIQHRFIIEKISTIDIRLKVYTLPQALQ